MIPSKWGLKRFVARIEWQRVEEKQARGELRVLPKAMESRPFTCTFMHELNAGSWPYVQVRHPQISLVVCTRQPAIVRIGHEVGGERQPDSDVWLSGTNPNRPKSPTTIYSPACPAAIALLPPLQVITQPVDGEKLSTPSLCFPSIGNCSSRRVLFEGAQRKHGFLFQAWRRTHRCLWILMSATLPGLESLMIEPSRRDPTSNRSQFMLTVAIDARRIEIAGLTTARYSLCRGTSCPTT